MNINHAKILATPDGDDTSVIRPSDWHAGHAITFAATQRVAGRNAAGSGPAEEVTASQLLDWASNTDGVLLTRTGGVWGAATNVRIESGDLTIARGTPTTPAANRVKAFGLEVAGKQQLAMMDPDGRIAAMQSHLGRTHVAMWLPAGGNVVTALGTAVLAAGTATARTPSNTNLLTSTIRVGAVSAATAGSAAGLRSNIPQFFRGDSPALGGFHLVMRFAISDAALVGTANMFAGLTASVAAPSDVAPSTLANVIGIGCDSGDTQLQLYAAGAAAQARTPLGASFPSNTTNVDAYELALYCPPNAAAVQYQVTRLNTGSVVTGTIASAASLPAQATFLAPHLYRANGGTAAAVGVDLASLYVETGV